MKKFIIRGSFFFAILLVANVIGYFLFSVPVILKGYLDPMDVDYSQYHTILLADSHGDNIEQDLLEPLGIYNLSHEADSYMDMYLKLSYLVRKGKKVDRIILTADSHQWSPNRLERNNLSRSLYYATYQHYDRVAGSSWFNFFLSKYFIRYTPLFDTNNSSLFKTYLLNSTVRETDDSEKSWVALSEKEQQEALEMRFEKLYSEGFESDKTKQAQEAIFSLCEQQGIAVIGIRFAHTPELRQRIGDGPGHPENLMKSRGIRVLEYSDLFDEQPEFFIDQDHINRQGAEAFVKILAEDLQTIL